MRQLFLHELQILGKIIFQRNDCHPWKVIYPLIRFEPPKSIYMKITIEPKYIPISFSVGQSGGPCLLIWLHPGASPPKGLFRDLFNNIISDLSGVQNDLLGKFSLKLGSRLLRRFLLLILLNFGIFLAFNRVCLCHRRGALASLGGLFTDGIGSNIVFTVPLFQIGRHLIIW